MPFVMVTMTYPWHKASEAGVIFRKLNETPLPPFLKRLHVFGRSDLECGVKGFAIYGVEVEKYYEGLLEIVRRMGQYASIEGFKWSADPVVESQAAATVRAT